MEGLPKFLRTVLAIIDGIERFTIRASVIEHPILPEEAALESAVQHLANGEPEDILGESYLERVQAADPEVLGPILRRNGLNMDHVSLWETHYGEPRRDH